MVAEATLKVYRFDPEKDKEGRFQEFKVPVQEGMVVLDAIHYIEENFDPTLSVRWNCKAARCGSCSAEINGFPRLMCKTRLDTLSEEITVSPMKAYPIVKDLVTDVSQNWEIEKRIPGFSPKKGVKVPWEIDQIDVTRSMEFRTCIECFLCQDICHVIREHKADYVGPRHMVKVASLDTHPMDSIDRSKFLHNEGGAGYCNITKCCQEVCPEHIKITDNAIIPEKESIVDNYYDPITRFIKKVRGK